MNNPLQFIYRTTELFYWGVPRSQIKALTTIFEITALDQSILIYSNKIIEMSNYIMQKIKINKLNKRC